MCGLVFSGGRNLISKDLTIFERMLMCDSFRGMHSTGVFSGFYIDKVNHYKLSKAKLDGFAFVDTAAWDEVKVHITETPPIYAAGKPIRKLNFPNFIFGHNRYATVGAINAENAHPFQHDHITMAHNGTLTDQSLLPDHTRFEVDSENVCYSIAKKGIDWTIQNLDGAFTLIWHDAKLNTVNIIRNDDRPFHLAENVLGEWHGASEELMLLWLMTREKAHTKIKRHFELEVGVQYIFDVSEGKCVLVEEKKHKLPTFTRKYFSNYSYNSYGYGDYNSSSHVSRINSTSTKSKNDEINLLLKDSGLPELHVGKRIKFLGYSFQPYSSNNERGKMEGCLPEHSEFVDIHVHGFEKKNFTESGDYFGEIVTAYELNAILTLIMKEVTVAKEAPHPVVIDMGSSPDAHEEMSAMMSSFHESMLDGQLDDIPFEIETNTLKDGTVVNREDWDSNPHTCCGQCDHPIAFSDLPDVEIYNGAFICGPCVDDLKEEELKQEAAQKVVSESGGTFCCSGCAQDLEVTKRSVGSPLICVECDKAQNRKVVDIHQRKTTMTGMTLTIAQWSKINWCRICNTRIPFSDVEVVPFAGSAPVCLDCEPKLKKTGK